MAWVSGYFWGLSQSQTLGASAPLTQAAALTAAKPAGKLTIIFASQTGNAKGVAEALEQEAQAAGIAVQLFDASDYKGKDLAKETHVILSLQPMAKAKRRTTRWSCMNSCNRKSAETANLQYGVIGLGDSSYFSVKLVKISMLSLENWARNALSIA